MRSPLGTMMLGLLLAPANLSAQDSTGEVSPLLSEVAEIALARSAAPQSVSGEATVLVLRGDQYAVALAGTSDVSCMVSRTYPGSLEPICYNAEAVRTIMQIEIRRVESRLAGKSTDEIEREVAYAIGSGELRLPSRPAIAYMMSSGQILISPDGNNVGSWLPHVMLYEPYITAADLGLPSQPSLDAAMVFGEGEATASIIVVVREFIDP